MPNTRTSECFKFTGEMIDRTVEAALCSDWLNAGGSYEQFTILFTEPSTDIVNESGKM